MLRIYEKFLLIVCAALTMFILLGLYGDTLTEPHTQDGHLRELLSAGYSRKGPFNARYRSLEQRRLVTNENYFINKSANATRPDTCYSCFPKFSYVYKNDNLCATTNATQIKLLVLIFTVHIEVKTRNILRKTWLSISKQNTGELRYVFMLGKHPKVDKLNERVLKEAKMYGDILFNDFMDEYKNLTFKTMSGLQFASEFCSHAKYVMKTDTDMWVNTPRLLQLIDSYKINNEVIGNCSYNKQPIRDKETKNYVSHQQYSGKFYPGFCSGIGYVTTMSVVKDIVKVSPNIPFFSLEDLYVGFCLQALGYKVRQVDGFHLRRPKLRLCGYKGIITNHRVPRGIIEKVWKTKTANCSNQTEKTNDEYIDQSAGVRNPRPHTCLSCFLQSFYVYKNDTLCSPTNNSQVKLLVLVLTVHNEIKTRNTLRKTWLGISKQNTGELRYVFLLGNHTREPNWNIKALDEAKKYGDIIINDFMDEYKNLTLKTMSGLQWASEFCSNAKYVMKTDADMLINKPKLLQFIDSFIIDEEIIKECYQNLKPHPMRDKKMANVTSYKQYPGNIDPGFCPGRGYVRTMQAVKDIVKLANASGYRKYRIGHPQLTENNMLLH